MAPAKKRPAAVIDLTNDEDDAGDPRIKQPRLDHSGFSASHVDDDDPSPIDLTQSEEGPPRELYGSIENKIVGVRYYNGVASPGEIVLCRREPQNQYDNNAIRVDNVNGEQIGHIPRTVAAKLAPYIDKNDIAIEAKLTGEKGMFDCPIRLFLYGASYPVARAALEQRLKNDKLIKATELKSTRMEAMKRRGMNLTSARSSVGLGGNGQDQVSMEELVQASEAVNFRRDVDDIKTLAMSEEDLAKMPQAAQPAALEARLLPYQLQGLAWLTARENPHPPAPGSDEVLQLWKRDIRGRYLNIASNFTVSAAPRLVSGGILADDMGLGKTLQMISLILTGGRGATLIVAPKTVMSNWEQQIRQHVQSDRAPKVFMFHGLQRRQNNDELTKHDVVITSYGTLMSEYQNGCILTRTKWRRVILDEGHTIRNARSKTAEAACALDSQSRWVLTGTPIVNNVRDLHSLLKFLRITGGIEQSEVFNTVIARPLSYGDARAEALLQSLMTDLCLRRKKDMKFVDLKLPPKEEFVHRIPFTPDERRKYDALLSEAKGALADYQKNTGINHRGLFQSVLERLLRLRQTCCHWTLCRERIEDVMRLLEEQGVVELNSKNRALLQDALRVFVESQESCAVCLDSMTNPVITHCKHAFCHACISEVIKVQQRCPMCRADLSEEKLLELPPETGDEVERELDVETKSSKTEALLKILQATFKNPSSKVIMFSQWTSFLNVIQAQLAAAGYRYTRIDGSMSTEKRDAAIKALEGDPDTQIMLASLSVCSVGLNLVAADTVILVDSWWAPAIEDQAVDRVHRLGQKRPTKVWRLVMEGSVEERVLDIQAEKRQLVTKAFREKGGKKKTEVTRMADIQKLLG